VTSRDVEFFINLLKAGKSNWGGYSPGQLPDNISKFTAISSKKFSITFNAAYSPEWLENNELSAIIPLPQQAWDKTSLSGTVGNYDLTSAGATRVFNFLNQQSLSLSTYASNPLWQAVDGPFHLTSYSSSTNYAALEPNSHYVGAEPAKISKLEELPFTSETAEFDALRSGDVDYGYLPTSDANQSHYFESRGDKVSAWPNWGINYMVINFSNPTLKPYFSQLYIRQALQDLVNQPQLIKDTLNGDGSPVDGPVPLIPKGPLVSPVEAHDPYPFSTSKARQLLAGHGWTIVADGTDSCSRPGTASDECGAGIKRGAGLTFPVVYPTGLQSIANGVQSWKSAASRIGLVLNIRELPLATIGEIAVPCTTGPSCTWGLVNWEGWGYQSPYPTGEETFSPTQTGGYDSATDNSNINATHTSSSSSAMFQYENYLARNLPVIWWPNSPSQVSVMSGKLHGVQQNALGSFTPNNWMLSS
jgi:peptide/nickel transport system substrate-binding protein